MIVHQWRCPFESCNHEQGPLQGDEQACATEYKVHLSRHSPVEFLELIPASQWKTAYKLVEEKA